MRPDRSGLPVPSVTEPTSTMISSTNLVSEVFAKLHGRSTLEAMVRLKRSEDYAR